MAETWPVSMEAIRRGEAFWPEELTVEVTQDDVAFGVVKDCNKCALALALTRQFPPPLGERGAAWEVDAPNAEMGVLGYEGVLYKMSPELAAAVYRFDGFEDDVPGEFPGTFTLALDVRDEEW